MTTGSDVRAGRAGPGSRRQCAAAALMVRPAAFGWNAETGDSNRFQARSALPAAELVECARQEFDAMVASLREAGVTVHAFDDRPVPICPDAVFPNNWVSFHDDGTVVLYPMLAPNRRRERRPELLQDLIRQGGYAVSRLLDLSHHELAGRCLEGTGSMVLDHAGRVAYACPSPRTHPAVLQEFCDELGFEACSFGAADRGGTAAYHTNVLLAIGERYAVICSEAVAERDRARVRGRLAESGRTLVEIGFDQLESFAGNMIELRASDGAGVLVISAQARAGLSGLQLDSLLACVGRLVVPPVRRIEQAGGGSVRCMIAEVFLPAQARDTPLGG